MWHAITVILSHSFSGVKEDSSVIERDIKNKWNWVFSRGYSVKKKKTSLTSLFQFRGSSLPPPPSPPPPPSVFNLEGNSAVAFLQLLTRGDKYVIISDVGSAASVSKVATSISSFTCPRWGHLTPGLLTIDLDQSRGCYNKSDRHSGFSACTEFAVVPDKQRNFLIVLRMYAPIICQLNFSVGGSFIGWMGGRGGGPVRSSSQDLIFVLNFNPGPKCLLFFTLLDVTLPSTMPLIKWGTW